MNLLSLGGFFSEAVAETWMSIWLSLNDLVYSLISVLYQLFTNVANVSLFSDEIFEQITGRIYIIMGIAMLFIFAYNLVLMIINPEDKKGSGQMGKVVKETIISLILIVLLPTIFKYMNIFQYHVLNSNVIGQIILGDTSAESDCDFSDMSLLNEYIKDEKSNVNIGSYCLKGGGGGAAVGYAIGAVIPIPVIDELAGLVGGAAIGCIGGTVVGGVEQLLNLLGFGESTVTNNLSAACQLYQKLPDAERGARTIAPTTFSAFYRPKMFGYTDCYKYLEKCGDDTDCNYTFDKNNSSTDEDSNGVIDTEEEKKLCAFYFYDLNMAKYTGDMSIFNEDSDFYSKVKSDSDIFEFNYLLAFAAGVLALYMFVCYTLAIGKRVAKLGFLQIISPITVMMRIIPKQKEAIYDKWQKELINTYLDVFIRLVIIYFALFAVSLVPDIINSLFESNGNGVLAGLSSVVVILGILQFAQEAPELFKQFFGGAGGGNFSLKSPRKQIADNKLAMRGVNAFRGGIYGATTGRGKHGGVLGGFLSGAGRGALGGYDKAVKGLDTSRTEYENGSRWYNRALDRARVGIGMETRGESDDRVVNNVKEKLKINSDMQKSTKNIKDIVTNTMEKDNSKIQMSVDGVTGNYQTLVKYSQTLLASAENEKDETKKKMLFQQYTDFMKHINDAKDVETEKALDAIIKGHNYKSAFKDHEIAGVSEEVAKIKSETGKIIGSAKEHEDFMKELGKENIVLTDQLNKGYSSNYKARKADSRMVRGNGESEKK